MLCYVQSVRELRYKGWRSHEKKSQRTIIRTLLPLRGFGQGPLYSSNCFVSKSVTLQKRSAQGCKRAKHKAYRPLDDRWVILRTSKAFLYFRARRDEICCAFDSPQFVDKITVKDRVNDFFWYIFLKLGQMLLRLISYNQNKIFLIKDHNPKTRINEST